MQCHVEVEAATIPKWARVPEYEETLTRTGSSAEALERAVTARLDAMAAAARALVQGIVDSAVVGAGTHA